MKIICIGRNYVDHIEELGNEKPDEPVIFLKPDTAILRNNQPFFYPTISHEIHHEVEILVRIDRVGKNIDLKFAHRYYHEIGLGIDFTARDLQSKAKEKRLPWDLAKGFDQSAPISRFIQKKDFDITKLQFRLDRNGQTVQQSDTSLMLFTVDEIIAYVSRFITLKIGDIIFTGTPKGVGAVEKGDRLEGYIEDRKMLDFNIK